MNKVGAFLSNTYREVDRRRESVKIGSKGKDFEKKMTWLAEKTNKIAGFVLQPLSSVITCGDNDLEVRYEKNYDKEMKTGISVRSCNLKKPHWAVVALMVALVVLLILPEIIALILKGLTHTNKQVRENFHWAKKHFKAGNTKLRPLKLDGIDEFDIEVLEKKKKRNDQFDRKTNTLIVKAKRMNLNENDTDDMFKRLFFHQSVDFVYNHKKIIFDGSGRLIDDEIQKKEEKKDGRLFESFQKSEIIGKVEKKELIKELEERGFLLKETKFRDGKTSKLFQKQFDSLEKALAYKHINKKTLKRYGVICIVKKKGLGSWDVIEGKKA